MSLRYWGLSALGFALTIVAAAPATAVVQLELSGNTYHAAVCPHGNPHNVARCFAHVVTDARGKIKEDQPNARPTGQAALTPADLRSAYKIPANAGSPTYTVAIVDAFGYANAESDLATYRAQYGLPACTTANGCFRKVDQRGGTSYPAADVGWQQETALDLDMVSAMCPNCHILLVEGDSALVTDLAAATDRAAALGAKAISNSYGLTESSGLTAYDSSYNHPGIAVTVSSGDNGYGVQFPANSPYVTAVGGTSLLHASNARGWNETVWAGAGSGCSTIEAKPSWQTDGLCARRTVADVSAVADPNTGVAVYGPVDATHNGWMQFGGTSVAAPLIAGIYGANGGAVNYGSDPYAHTGALFDVTSGKNGTCGRTYFCTGAVGYDGPTGLGTPNGVTAF